MTSMNMKHATRWSSAARSASPAEGVPQWIDREGEPTSPQALATAGPTHNQLRALAAGRSPPLTLASRYQLDRRLAHGGMATVFAGRLLSLDRPVAIKILDETRGDEADNRFARFVAEAHMTSHLRHPNIIDIHDLGSTQEGVLFMVMELLEGEDLRSLIRRSGPLPWAQIQAIMRDICEGLAAVHRAGLVHRDLKPANCFLTNGVTKLIDFGIATRSNSLPRSGVGDASVPSEPRVTQGGRVLGTPEYMSPEQAEGRRVDARSDIYTAGILLGELLTGKIPFEGDRATLVIADQVQKVAPTLFDLVADGVVIRPAVESIYARALSKRPDDRFATITAFAAAIAAVPAPRPMTQPSWLRQWRRDAAAIFRATTDDGDPSDIYQPSPGPKRPRARTRHV